MATIQSADSGEFATSSDLNTMKYELTFSLKLKMLCEQIHGHNIFDV